MRPGSRAGGFTYFGLLLAIATAAGAIAGGTRLLANDLRREKELDLLFAGDEIRRAIEAYHARNNAGIDPYPKTLEALLRDPNQPAVVRYLRRVRGDPMREPGAEAPPGETGGWVLIRDAQARVIGVHSPSTQAPLKRSGFPKHYEPFSQARSYADWKFIAAGALQAPVNAPASAGGNFIPSPIPPGGPLVPAGRGVPSAAPAAPATAARAPSAPLPGEAAATRVPESPLIRVEPPAGAVAAPAPASPPPVPEPQPAVPVPAAAPAVSAPAAPPQPAAPGSIPPPPPPAPATASAPAPAGGVPAAAGAAAAQTSPQAAPQAAPQAPAAPPSLQGDGPQSFQIRTF